jgi:type II secretory pathway pseudopilin PulG
VIIGIFAALSGPSFLNWLNQKRVDDALTRIEGAIKETQAEAIKGSKDCTVTIPKGVNQTITGSCLVTGNRQIADVTIDHSANNNPWTITFDFKGRNRRAGEDPGTLWLTIPDSSVKPKCLTISVGIGLMRTGNYDEFAAIKCQVP